MAEFFALAGYDVTATTLVANDATAVEKRIAALRAKGLTNGLSFKIGAMESIDAVVMLGSFDAVYVHQALHHAHDWAATLRAAYRTLKAEGWLIIADEPNVLHSLLGYRMGKMSGTRERGMSRRKIIRCLRHTGYREVRPISPRLNDRLHPHWVVARK
jgi:SAM-dependent methyltransferase